MLFPGVIKLWDLYVGASLRVFKFAYFIIIYFLCAGKNRKGKLVNWVEKASFKKIQKLLKISELERHHEILFTMKNLHELSRSPSPYIIPIIPRPLPTKIVEGEHYVIADILYLAPGSSSPVKNFEIEAVGREPVISTQSGQPSLAKEDSSLIPQASKNDDRSSHFEHLPFSKKGSCPKHLRKAGGCPNGQRRLERGWKILSLGFSQHLAAPLLGKRKKRRTR